MSNLSVFTKAKPESFISNQLAVELHGQREVQTPAGKIDVLTDRELIEIKVLKRWKSALGQLLAYGEYYPNYQLRLHLIGEPSAALEAAIQKACQRIGAILTWQSAVLFSDAELHEKRVKAHQGSEQLKHLFLSIRAARQEQNLEATRSRPIACIHALDILQQAADIATEIEALPDSTLKALLTEQLSRALQTNCEKPAIESMEA